MKKYLSLVLCLTLVMSLVAFSPAGASAEENGIYYFNDFDSETGIVTAEYTDNMDISVTTDAEGNSIMKIESLRENGDGVMLWYPKVDNREYKDAGLPDMVLEFRAKFTYQTNHSAYLDTVPSRYDASVGNIGLSSFRLGRYWYPDSIFTDEVTAQNEQPLVTPEGHKNSEWHTYTVVYSGTEHKRDIYLDGSLLAEDVDSLYPENDYVTHGVFQYILAAYLPGAGSTVEMDYLKIYEKPVEFTASVRNSDSTELKNIVVDFSEIPGRIDKTSFSVEGNSIEAVSKLSGTSYMVEFKNDLTDDTTYTLKLNNIATTTGLALSASEITFKTKPGLKSEEKIYYYNDFDNETGIVEAEYADNMNIGVATAEDGKSILKIESKAENNDSIMLHFPMIDNRQYKETGLPDLTLEFRAKRTYDVGEAAYLDTHTGRYDASIGYVGLESVRIGYLYAPDNLYTDGNWTQEIQPVGHKNDEWHTYTISYSGTEHKRDIYMDGNLLAKDVACTNTNADYVTHGVFKYILAGYLPGEGSTIQLDYLKIYESSDSFAAEIKNSTSTDVNNLYVEFNGIPANITPASFSVNNAVVSSVIPLSQTEYMLSFEDKLAENTDYTLTLNNITGTKSQSLKNNTFSFRTGSTKLFTDEAEISYFNDFDSETGIVTAEYTDNMDISVTTDAEGNSIMKIESLRENGDGVMLWYPKVDNREYKETGLPDMVLEFRAKFTYQTNHSAYLDTVPSRYDASVGNIGLSSFRLGRYWYPDSIFTDETTAQNEQPLVTPEGHKNSEWHTYTVVYSGTEHKRDIYLDGSLLAEDVDSLYPENDYVTHGVFQYILSAYLPGAGSTVEMDYLKYGIAPNPIDFVIENDTSSETNEIVLNFNAAPSKLGVENIIVNGKTAKSVSVIDEASHTYKVEFAEELEEGSVNTLSVVNVTDNMANKLNKTANFKTKGLPSYDLIFNVSGNAKAESEDGTEIRLGAVLRIKENAEYKFSIACDFGYKVETVVVNEEVTDVNSDGLYSIVITKDTTVDITVTKDESLPAVISPLNKAYTENGNVSAVCGKIVNNNSDYVLKEYGAVYSNTTNEPVYNAENSLTYKGLPPLKSSNLFAIEIIDKNNTKLGKAYYARPYAIFEKTEDNSVITSYGETLSINFPE